MKSEKGSITMFTLIAMVILLTISFTAYMSAMIKLQTQSVDIDEIKANYERSLNVESLKTIYENLTAPERKGKASKYTCIDGVYCNSPELIGFNLMNTYYVTYDSSGKETISSGSVAEEDIPVDWYNYREKRWANVVTINNGNKTYWVWIPRFVYKTPADDSSLTAKTTDVKFVGLDENGNDYCYVYENGIETTLDISSYHTSDAFTFNGKQLKGYWVSKYRVQEGENIIDKEQTEQEEQASLANIEVDVSGFNPAVTKYVTYDDEGKETIGNNIELNASGKATNQPNNWYDYKNKKWANIVTENNGNKTYWTYIPRYEYKIRGDEWQYLNESKNKLLIKFLKITDPIDDGYKISDAFTFNEQPLKGYWVSKYRIQEGENLQEKIDEEINVANIEVDVSGFNPAVTKYVTYDDEGNETIGNNIEIAQDGTAANKPNNWYDYKNKKWANIVTENNGLKAYWTYVPRFQYKMPTEWIYLKPEKQFEIKFMKSTDSLLPGYKTSDAFTFNGQTLRGYWASKYRIQE